MSIQKLLIANRGEIACRIIRTCHRLGIRTVAVFSDVDSNAPHVRLADEAVRIGRASVNESYLRGDRIIEAALKTNADAIHPGYGFLSENPDFVDAVFKAGLIFIGPSASSIRSMGLKDKAKAAMEAAGVPVVPGYHGDAQDAALLREEAEKIGFPVLIKARAGGGGKGMRLVEHIVDFDDALLSARREAESSFGDPACLVEKFVSKPRHIEIQVFGDQHGSVLHLFERDCSLQRRHQKVLEEAPAPDMPLEMRTAMGEAAVAAAKAVNYVGAGTVEFIVDASDGLRPDRFWFMEMNTRLQVEHPVTEAVTGLDLVELQLRVAEGKPLPFAQRDLQISGHALEARLYAEDPAQEFLPATGRLERLSFPSNVRVDSGVVEGDEISPHYDPMIAKIIVHGPDRTSALRNMAMALDHTVCVGTKTNCDFLRGLVRHPDFASGDVDTGLIERSLDDLIEPMEPDAQAFALAAVAAISGPGDRHTHQNFRLHGPARQIVRFDEGEVAVESSGDIRSIETPVGNLRLDRVRCEPDRIFFSRHEVSTSAPVVRVGHTVVLQLGLRSHTFHISKPGISGDHAEAGSNQVVAPMPGRIVDVRVKPGQAVSTGDRLIVLEAMKMEHSLKAPRDGEISKVNVAIGDQVEQGAILFALADEETA